MVAGVWEINDLSREEKLQVSTFSPKNSHWVQWYHFTMFCAHTSVPFLFLWTKRTILITETFLDVSLKTVASGTVRALILTVGVRLRSLRVTESETEISLFGRHVQTKDERHTTALLVHIRWCRFLKRSSSRDSARDGWHSSPTSME